jgi:glucose-6-phosphate dehydrogenase assembly protein OpcA
VIIDLPATTTSAVNHKLVSLRETGGAIALGRVMTLVIVSDDADVDNAIASANEASREHPCRVLALARGEKRGSSRLDAQIRVGGDAGASEVIVLRLYGPLVEHGNSVIVPLLLPDAPVVAWWPGPAPENPSTDAIGRMAQRRITDASASKSPSKALTDRSAKYSPGDTDLAWTRLTRWRALLAAALDQPPFEPVSKAIVSGGSDSPSTDLLAAWLGHRLRCAVVRKKTAPGTGMVGVTLERPSGPVVLERPDGSVASLTQPGQPLRRIAMPRRSDVDCLLEELRRMDPDEIYYDAVTKGLAAVRGKPAKAGAGSASRGGRGSGDARANNGAERE